MKIYPVSETQLSLLKLWALLSLLIVPVPFFIFYVVRLVARLHKHTEFGRDGDTAVQGGTWRTYIGVESPAINRRAEGGGGAGTQPPVGTLYTCTGRWIAPSSVQYDYVCWGASGSGGDPKPDHKIKLEVM